MEVHIRFLDLLPPVSPGLDSKRDPNMEPWTSSRCRQKSLQEEPALCYWSNWMSGKEHAASQRRRQKFYFCFLFVCFPIQVLGRRSSGKGNGGFETHVTLGGNFSLWAKELHPKSMEKLTIAFFILSSLSPLCSHGNLVKETWSVRQR